MRLVIILLMLISTICFSQSIIWEREYELSNFPLSLSLLPTIIDSDGNIITTVDPGAIPLMDSYFFKYDTSGNLLEYKKQFIGRMLIPVSFYETEIGYKVFCTTNNNFNKNSSSLPIILNIFKNADSTGLEIPYDVMKEEQNDTVNLLINKGNNNNTISIFNKFYNTSARSTMKVDSITFQNKGHLIISCYDSSGKIVWRKGIDTLDIEDKYHFSDLKTIKSNKLIILLWKYINNKDYITQIIEVDTTGNITKKFELPYIDKNFIPVGIDEAESDSYVVVGRYSNEDNSTGYLLTKMNNNNEIVKNTYLPKKNLGINYESIFKTPKGNYLILGNTLTDTSLGFFLYKFKMLITQYNSELEYISDIEYHEYDHNRSSELRHIHFIDKSNFIAVGCKDIYKFYIAKFSDSSLTDVTESKLDGNEINIRPNPVTDFIYISTNDKSFCKIEIFSSLGLKVIETENKNKLDVSNLNTGLYFLIIGNKVFTFLKV